MAQKIWRVVANQSFDVYVQFEDQGTGGFGQAATAGGQAVQPTATNQPPANDRVTWTYPAFTITTDIVATLDLMAASGAKAGIYVEVRQNGQVVKCQERADGPILNGGPDGTYEGVQEGEATLNVTKQISLVLRKALAS